ncbi:MAG TPA: hypothetical protein VIM57_11120, partial [Luteolibacter sp.]
TLTELEAQLESSEATKAETAAVKSRRMRLGVDWWCRDNLLSRDSRIKGLKRGEGNLKIQPLACQIVKIFASFR